MKNQQQQQNVEPDFNSRNGECQSASMSAPHWLQQTCVGDQTRSQLCNNISVRFLRKYPDDNEH